MQGPGNIEMVVMTKDQLAELLDGVKTAVVDEVVAALSPLIGGRKEGRPEFVFGLEGICDLFHVKKSQAQQYKNTFLAPACTQNGRVIKVDVNMALQLFDEHSAKVKPLYKN